MAYIASLNKAVMLADTTFLVDETFVDKSGRYITVNGKGANALAPNSQVITVPASASGARLICDARLENAGG